MESGVSSRDTKKLSVPLLIFALTFLLLGFVQIKIENPLILVERFIKGAGWVEIIFISLYGAFIGWKMQERKNVPRWRIITWTIFSVVFFSQLVLGLSGLEKFLMTGRLHLPIPMMIIAGPLYRWQLSVMPLLFISTVILTGPAWCSHLCYFGALDGLASAGKPVKNPVRYTGPMKSSFLTLVVIFALVFRWFELNVMAATVFAVSFGIAGIGWMIFYSSRIGKMAHCILYCPVGTLVNILKYLNPFRMHIDTNCTFCMKCTAFCKYDALNPSDIEKGKPGFTCTLCGDCLAGCSHNSIKYKFFRISPEKARNLYLVLTITLHASFLALARI